MAGSLVASDANCVSIESSREDAGSVSEPCGVAIYLTVLIVFASAVRSRNDSSMAPIRRLELEIEPNPDSISSSETS
jgi:hypothetical protein